MLLSHVWLFATPWTAACQASLSFTVSWSLLKLMSTESVIPSNHLILCRPFLPLPSIFPSIRVFFPMSWLFSSGGQSIGASALALVLPMSIQDWFALGLGVWSPCCSGDSQESFPTPHSKASILWCSAFFMVHFSHHYMTTGKSINLTIWAFVGKVMSLLLNILSKFVIAFQMMVYSD